jgi:hypothetical protein
MKVLTMKRKVLVKKAVMAAAAVMMETMMELKLVLTMMTLFRRLISPAETLEHLLLIVKIYKFMGCDPLPQQLCCKF